MTLNTGIVVCSDSFLKRNYNNNRLLKYAVLVCLGMHARAPVNTGRLLRTVFRLFSAGVTVVAKYHYASRPASAPWSVEIKAGKGYIIASDTFQELTNNGYRFVNAKADEHGMVISFEREYA